MARDEIQKQSAESKKKDEKYKDIIKNGEYCRTIFIRVTRNKFGYEYCILLFGCGREDR
jgi:hypothetical protein